MNQPDDHIKRIELTQGDTNERLDGIDQKLDLILKLLQKGDS